MVLKFDFIAEKAEYPDPSGVLDKNAQPKRVIEPVVAGKQFFVSSRQVLLI